MPNHILKNILILAPAHTGDMVMTHTLFRLIKQQIPNIIIDVLTPQTTAPLLSFMPEINRLFQLPCTHNQLKLWTRYQLARKLKSNKYDAAILLQHSFKSALIPFLARIPKRIGYKKECRSLILTHAYPFNRKKHLPYVKQQLLLLEKIGIHISDNTAIPFPTLSVTKEQQKKISDQFNLMIHKKPILILCPGAQYGLTKQWPVSHFAQIAQHKIEQGWEVWILGAKWDKEIATTIEHHVTQKVCNFTGNTTLKEAIILMSFADQVITNDSGLMHIAAALDKKIIALYGSSSATYTPPLTPKATIMSLHLACSPCFKKKCPLGHYDCLKKLTPDMLPDF